MEMNPRQRFLEVATFGDPDKVPLALGDVLGRLPKEAGSSKVYPRIRTFWTT